MANVYISFLGTNRYQECIYYYDEQFMPPIRFVQEATLRLFCRQWQETDRILIFTTRLAFEKNWQDNGHSDGRKGLGQCIQDLGLRAEVLRIDIPDGHSEEEIWQIFSAVFNSLSQGDEVVFDITHAFRSIPMLAVVVLNYAKVLKNIGLQGIFYGAFEKLGQPREVEVMPVEDRKVPILNLTAFDQLLDWTLAVDRFLGAGDAKAVCALARKSVMPILKESKGGDAAAAAIRKLADSIENYSRNLATCRTPEVSQSVVDLREKLEKSWHVDMVKPLFHLFEPIEKQVREFKGDIVGDGIQAARWCLECNLIQQGVTILFETLITYLLYRVGADYLDRALRNAASSAVQLYNQKKPESEWTGDAALHAGITKKIIEVCDKNTEVAKLLDRLNKVRNDINHAGYKKDSLPAKVIEEKFRSELKNAEVLYRTFVQEMG